MTPTPDEIEKAEDLVRSILGPVACDDCVEKTLCVWHEVKKNDLAPALAGARFQDDSKVTRFEVIDHTLHGVGRVVVERGVTVRRSYQDDDRTLKVFLTNGHGNG